jgi:hypothetical protein
MLDDAFGHAKLGETRTELQRLRCEIAAWHKHRIAKDSQQQYATPLKVLNELFTKALADIESAAGGDTADAAASWADSRRLDRALVWVRRLWNFFGSRFDQRDGDTPAAALLKAADEMVWSCYIEPFRLTGRPRNAAPVPYIEDRFSPQATPRDDPPPDLKSDVDAAFLANYLKALPVALIGLPPSCLEHPWWMIYLAHEVGHHVQYDLPGSLNWELVGSFADRLFATAADPVNPSVAERWKGWGREIFADAYSVLTVGPAALWAIVQFEFGSDNTMSLRRSAYPPPIVRFSLMAALLQELGVDAASGLRGVDPAAFVHGDPIAVGTRDLRAEALADFGLVPRVVNMLTTAVILDGHTLPELAGWDADAFTAAAGSRVFDWSAALSAASKPYPEKDVRAARYVTAGAVLAWANACEDAARAANPTEQAQQREVRRRHLKTQTLTTVATCREEGTRAGEALQKQRPIDLGEQLAALVMNAPGL